VLRLAVGWVAIAPRKVSSLATVSGQLSWEAAQMRRHRVFIVVAILTVVAASCSSDGGDTTSAETAANGLDASATSVTTAPPTEATPTTSLQEAEGPVMTPAKEAFVERYNDVVNGGDTEAFTALFDSGATRIHNAAPSLSYSLERMIEEAQHLWNQESVITLTECTATLSGVSCLAERTGPVETAFGEESFKSRNVYSLSTDGTITEIRVGATNFDGRLDVAFREWLRATHPDVAEGLVPDSSRGLYEAVAYDDSEIYLEWAPVWADLGRPYF